MNIKFNSSTHFLGVFMLNSVLKLFRNFVAIVVNENLPKSVLN